MHSSAFSDNLRSVRDETVETVMKHFFEEHPAVLQREIVSSPLLHSIDKTKEDIQCEEALLEAFGQ